jgi:hypothetical protein
MMQPASLAQAQRRRVFVAPASCRQFLYFKEIKESGKMPALRKSLGIRAPSQFGCGVFSE